jgi:flagellar basal body-associated protein FliL
VRRLIIIAVILGLLVAGGGLTSLLIGSNNGSLLPVLTTTEDPDAAVQVVTGWKAEQLFYLIGFIVFNLIGIAATLALVFWFLDRGVRRARAQAQAQEKATASDNA